MSNDHPAQSARKPGRYGHRPTPKAFVFASDPQYPWTADTDDSTEQPEATRISDSARLINEQYASIARYRASLGGSGIPVMINGDLTAFGHGWQRDFIHSAFKRHLNDNYYFGLGNHDYQNNLDDTFNNGAARDSLLDLIGHHRNRVDALDLTLDEGAMRSDYSGSLAYSVNFGRVRMIQLNSEPTYGSEFTSGWAWPLERRHHFRIVPSLDWLEAQLREAGDYGQITLLNLHKPNGWANRTGQERFRAMLGEHRVAAIFAGHHHKEGGRWYRDLRAFGEVPIYLSGSTSQRTFLLAELSDDADVLSVKLAEDNNWAAARELDRLKLR